MQRRPFKLALATAIAITAPLGRAESIPETSPLDSRIQIHTYNGDIVRVVTAEGRQTTIALDKGEIIKDFAMGDREAWKAKFNGNLFMLKPSAVHGDTNLTIFTTKGAHVFELKMLKNPSPRVAYWLEVRNKPEPPAPAGAASGPSAEALAAAAKELEKKRIADDMRDAKYQGRLNHDYWVVGAPQLQPVAAYDNGTFTFLSFSASNPLPAPFYIEPDGTESMPDFHMENNGATIVLHRVTDRIILRRGNLVAGVTNHAVDRPSQPSPTGTISDRVKRVIPQEGTK